MTEAGRYLVLGTAGHIDHGKTTLIKALTGIDCDTLSEEKERGITINLGFAHYTLPDGTQLGIVDVPGHKRFIRNMVAGAVGIDLVLLAVAADDGVMPQTTEHLNIARLLGVQAGLVALTKIDLVDEDLRELAAADVAELIAPTFLADSPIIPVSAATGQGIEELKQAFTDIAAQVPSRRLGDMFRMPVDRSFTIRGAGTVVTGTTLAGTVRVDDELELVPGGRKVRVRGLQVHGASVKVVGPGHRTAINLAGVTKELIQRGHVLVAPGSLDSTYMFDASLESLPDGQRRLRRGTEVMLHIGTTELTAKLHPLEREGISPGEKATVQLRLQQEAAIAAGDRFILRDSSATTTLGGGVVLDAHPRKHRRRRQVAADRLAQLSTGDLTSALKHEIGKTPFGLVLADAETKLNASGPQLIEAVARARDRGIQLTEHKEGRKVLFTLPENRERVRRLVREALETHRSANPLVARGLGLHELAKTVGSGKPQVSTAVLRFCLDEGVQAGELRLVDETYALPERDAELSEPDMKAVEVILEKLNESATPPQPDEFLDGLPVNRKRSRQLVDYLVERGEIIIAPGAVYFGEHVVKRARQALHDYFESKRDLTVSQFNKLIGSSRKYGMPLLHYFEQTGILQREGDVRRLSPGEQERD